MKSASWESTSRPCCCGQSRRRVFCRGTFREDLLSRINLWSFELPGLARRRDDIEPNVHYELGQLTSATGRMYRFSKEALQAFVGFAVASDAPWSHNFRDLNAAIGRMATMAPSGRITRQVVDSEIQRLRRSWRALSGAPGDGEDTVAALLGPRAEDVDEFDRVQLVHVVRVCREEPTLSAAGRRLFAVSRSRRKTSNDADRLRKYLLKFGLDWGGVREGAAD
jgi:transcriptional regulatory protein RtcR